MITIIVNYKLKLIYPFLFQVVIASVGIALISVLSAIGIVERIRIETGGVYFLIAHTLGSRFGGSLGLLYCFGQAVGCALNVLGIDF